MTAPDLLPPDDFPLAADDPLYDAHRFVQGVTDDVLATGDLNSLSGARTGPHHDRLDGEPEAFRAAVLRAAARRVRHAARLPRVYGGPRFVAVGVPYGVVVHLTFPSKYGTPAPAATAEIVADLAATAAACGSTALQGDFGGTGLKYLAGAAAEVAKAGGLTDAIKADLAAAADRLRDGATPLGQANALADRFDAAAGRPPQPPISPGEPWADAALTDLAAEPPAGRAAWDALLVHCTKATATDPSAAWLKQAGKFVAAVEADSPDGFAAALARWLPPVTTENPAAARWFLHPRNARTLKGLLWCCAVPGAGGGDLAGGLEGVMNWTYRHVDGHGPRQGQVGRAAAWALVRAGADGRAAVETLRDGSDRSPVVKALDKVLTDAP